jgi:hypothetical protein
VDPDSIVSVDPDWIFRSRQAKMVPKNRENEQISCLKIFLEGRKSLLEPELPSLILHKKKQTVVVAKP